MRIIENNSELAILSGTNGFVFSDRFGNKPHGQNYNVLHEASCPFVLRNIYATKIYFSNFQEALQWLKENRGDNWRRCGDCLIRLPSLREEMMTMLGRKPCIPMQVSADCEMKSQ